MPLPAKPTLGTLRQELLDRLGFASQGASAGNIVSSANSFLKRAQDHIYWEYDFEELRLTYDYSTAIGQTLYDWRDDMEPRQILQLRAYVTNTWIPLSEGVEYNQDSYVGTRYYPQRYDRRAQLEIWPEPDAIYLLRCEYYQRLNAFTEDEHRCTVDDMLVFTLALANAKAHYKQSDAQTYFDQFAALIRKLKKRNLGNKRFVVGDRPQDAMPKPVVIE